MVRSGRVDNSIGRLGYPNSFGRVWSSGPSSYTNNTLQGARAYQLGFDDTILSAIGDHFRWYGYPLRCLSADSEG